MELPRSFRSLAPRTTGSGKPPTPTTATTSAAPTTVPAPAALNPAVPTTAPASAKPTTAPASAKPTTAPASAKPTTAPASEPRATTSAKKTTTTAKRSRLPFLTRTDLVTALPATLPCDYDAKRAAKGKSHERKIARDRVIGMTGWERNTGHEPEAGVENFKKQVEDEKHRTENSHNAVDELRVERDTAFAQIDRKNKELIDKAKEIATLKAEAQRSATALLAEAEKSVTAFAAAEEREQYSAAIVKKRDGELSKVVDRLRRADDQIQSPERKIVRAKDKFDELQGDPRKNMVYQVHR
ncbi:hypothetical protein AALP_AA2G080800 [Arabis alpina]|uniref:Uncharacterized protein n=1 Tax=Arabis alpina TaxID=50452 RepID=A0A087HG13_ARAAL|nr:hypothetical protein AALP_AA2G080800 [Arabis alpina]